ncbi:MAG TPA: histidine kinase dimerization/phospho-acceptor domain-containing protein, partial [Xanthobacteraceae bacterium]|nr:histidine kinase dimerization/phospho-acceptor domain-containing protein [Xanthobacteraceae bacterium]
MANHAAAAAPAWLWAADGTRVLWANAAGAALLGAANPSVLAERRMSATQPLAAQVMRLAGTLPHGGAPRLERLRGIGAGVGRTVACACSRFSLANGMPAILIAAAESVGPALPLAERMARLFAGCGAPVAAFLPDGTLVHATPIAAARLGAARNLTALGADQIAAQARNEGRASGDTAIGPATIERIGSGATAVLVVSFADTPQIPLAETPQFTSARVRGESLPSGNDPRVDARSEPGEGASTQGALPLRPPHPDPLPASGEGEPALSASGAREPSAPPAKPERRHPLRFVWQIDPSGVFTLSTSEFAEAMGPRTLAVIGQSWRDVADALGLDPDGRIEQAVASRDTWSGIHVAWPVDGLDERVDVELSGLPTFERDRTFRGYRGFGVCRDVERLNAAAARQPELTPAPPADARAAEESAEDVPAPEPSAPASPTAQPEQKPLLTLVPASKNVVPFRGAAPAADKRPALSPVERTNFREIGKVLGAEDEGGDAASAAPAGAAAEPVETIEGPVPPTPAEPPPAAADVAPAIEPDVLDRLPVGVLVYRGARPLHANRTLLDWTGYADLPAMADAGLDYLFEEAGVAAIESGGAARALTLATRDGATMPLEAQLSSVPWDGGSARMLVLAKAPAEDRHKSAELALRAIEAENRELKSILDTATDGVIVLERDGRIVTLSRSAEALFGYEAHEIKGYPLIDLLAPESHRAAQDYLDGLTRNGVASVLNDGREVIGRVRQGGLIPLFMTMGRIGESGDKFCAVLRDITQWKRAEEDLLASKRQAERASSAKSDFLAKISHEIRTPLNAVIGFSEVMMEERFGPIGNERYREYLKDIHASGGHLVSLINDLLDLSKIEAGKLDLTFTSVNLNGLVQQCVALMQPQANRERIIIRTSLAPTLPQVVVDARSIRQIVLNLLSNSIKFTGAGGQVIVSTALTDRSEAVLRVRDTGVGMSEKEIEA